MTASLIVGLETSYVQDLPAKLDQLHEERLTCIVAPLFHPRFRRDSAGVSDARDGPQTRSDLVLDSRGWTSSVVGQLSTWVDYDASCDATRATAEKVFKEEIAWASHLSLAAIMTPPLHATRSNANYARLLNQAATQASYAQFWVKVPMYYPGRFNEDDASFVDSWEAWNNLRSMCEFNPKIHVALEVTADLPDVHYLDRWLGEPLAAVIVPTDIFLTNKKGYPTLSKMHQKFFLKLFQHKIRYFLKGRPHHHQRYLPYVQYLEHLWSTRSSCPDAKATFEAPYLDYLQAPLQPLMDNLESQTYETFEQDPVKYAQYEVAITQALAATPSDKISVVMVVGAGRGPIVRCALRASVKANRTIKLYALDKNPNAVVTLRNMKQSEKWDNVTVVSADMRVWKAPELADIMVSELLGSFGDNELSPECLDGAQSFLHADGISIPARYTSFVAPISSSKLWNEVKGLEALTSLPQKTTRHRTWCDCTRSFRSRARSRALSLITPTVMLRLTTAGTRSCRSRCTRMASCTASRATLTASCTVTRALASTPSRLISRPACFRGSRSSSRCARHSTSATVTFSTRSFGAKSPTAKCGTSGPSVSTTPCGRRSTTPTAARTGSVSNATPVCRWF
ncbi:hypothetical protein SPRG_02020 [Saprolegnia parasitica CBS 223.65]|uniref:Protein arginine N-methyltransferase n=1 Tax=Saprolegnia parasitica (strain CBS 223.65) TaxID=695850 RepID=A0A067CRV8_SAPPC|nr:hypothetical protein SPRG_02020 [Saprolegnia parasitica CBS 223.65]KDO33208.1 hypothetical protein SPRG_02020 [Saprolegnia parasitica CBS 223.65]|eukprot:XP_012195967.1 hypothetical protein SPRG_02020 [Saprolegnia parasitica CBS 223.65]